MLLGGYAPLGSNPGFKKERKEKMFIGAGSGSTCL